MNKVLVTGAAGFIGSYLSIHLSQRGMSVVGLDSISEQNRHNFKYERLAQMGFPKSSLSYGTLLESKSIKFIQLDLNDLDKLKQLFEEEQFDYVLNLAAQTGVRYSVTNPLLYIDNNIKAFCSLMEVCKEFPLKNVIYSSSSSVYGSNEIYPFKENEATHLPLSVYAATKKSDELIAHAYSSLYQMPTTGLRFFTVYGPWTRTNMAVYLFIKAINEGTPITLFNNGEMYRDFTYVGDVATSISRIIEQEIIPKGNKKNAPYDIFNIGHQEPVKISELIFTIEQALDKTAIIDAQPLQAGDMVKTFADTDKLYQRIGYKPGTTLKEGINKTVEWYLKFIEQCEKTYSYS
ncbi:MAG: GDP-mannose 4,6-dehydratase [Flavobacteriales bacterium]|nr:GDP-mannose 4,6-dehydratase [Flavobacteriales bacterium]